MLTTETKLRIGIAVALALVGLGFGVIIGYFAAKDKYSMEESAMIEGKCGPDINFYNQAVKRNMDSCVNACRSSACVAQSCQIPQPRSYVAYHLQGKTVLLDGRINEEAWNEVPWTENFVDVRGEDYPTPHYVTKAKLRWDEDNMYVAAYLQDEDVWANKTEHDSHVWRDNSFEIFFDVDGSTQNYKQTAINALQTVADLMLPKAYIDGGRSLVRMDWESDVRVGIYTDGVVNDPDTPSTYWSMEAVFPFSKLHVDTRRDGAPADSEIWRTVLARSEYPVKIIDGRYEKIKGIPGNWWSWNAHGAPDFHLPDKWGLIQFSRAPVNTKQFTTNEQWRVSEALFDTFNALRIFMAEHSRMTTELNLLDLPQYILSGLCVGMPEIYRLPSWNKFIISINSKDGTLEGNIRDDRYLWFGRRKDGMQRGGRTTTVSPNITTV